MHNIITFLISIKKYLEVYALRSCVVMSADIAPDSNLPLVFVLSSFSLINMHYLCNRKAIKGTSKLNLI